MLENVEEENVRASCFSPRHEHHDRGHHVSFASEPSIRPSVHIAFRILL